MVNDQAPARIRQRVYGSRVHPFLEVRTTYASRQPYAPHFHDTWSLGVILDGRTVLTSPGETLVLRPGNMVLLAPGEVHQCNPVDGWMRGYHMFQIAEEWVRTILHAAPDESVTVGDRVSDHTETYTRIAGLADSIARGTPNPAGMDALATLVLRSCRVQRGAPGRAGFDARFLEQGSIAHVAGEMGLGRERFIRSFRRRTGMTPGSYRQCLRLHRAQRLLREGKDIVHAALEGGFADQSHFHRMCVKYFAATPRQLTPHRSLSYKK